MAVELALTVAAVSVRRSMADQNILPCGTVGDSLANNGAYAAFILPSTYYACANAGTRQSLSRGASTMGHISPCKTKGAGVYIASHDCRLASSQSSLPLVKTPITLIFDYNRRGKFQETGSLQTISYTASSVAGAVVFVMTGSS